MLKFWKQDLKASVVVFLVALPLCLGIALASNAPLSSGLLAGMVGGIVVGVLSNSQISVSGPAAGLTVIVATAVSELGSFNTFSMSVFYAGIIQVIFSFLRGGSIGNFFPTSVIKGMLAAIGLILILKQFPHMIGYDVDFMGDFSFKQADQENTFSEILIAFNRFHVGSLIIGFISLSLMVGWEKAAKKNGFFQFIPGALVAVLLGVVINLVFQNFFPWLAVIDEHLVTLPFEGGIKEFFAGFTAPDWSQYLNPKVLSTALVIAIVASIESLLSVEAADKLDESGRVTTKNRELFAQGVGNSLSGLIGGLPITAVIVRTSANASAGAKTNLSAILHGVWLVLCVVAIPQLLNMIPLSTLAAMLILVGYKLVKPELIKAMFNKGHNQFVPFVVTILAILFTDLLVGIFVGMIVGFYFVFRSNIHKSIVMVSEGNSFLIRFYKDVSFLQKSILLNLLESVPENSAVIIDGSKNVFVDDDINELIEDFIKRAALKNIKVELKKSTTALSPLFKEEAHG
jgi:MFS superfamily sulfate permease-like transporter